MVSFKYRRATDWLRIKRIEELRALESWTKHFESLGVRSGVYEKEAAWPKGGTVTYRALFVEGQEENGKKRKDEDFIMPDYKHIAGSMFSVREPKKGEDDG